MDKTNKSLKEKVAGYLRYHPVSGKLLILVFIGYLTAIIISVSVGTTYITSGYQIAFFLLVFWLPSVPIALKTKNKYSNNKFNFTHICRIYIDFYAQCNF